MTSECPTGPVAHLRRRRAVTKTASVVAAVTFMATAVLGACGGDDDDESSSTATTDADAATSESTLPAPEMTDVKLVTAADSSAWGWLYVGEAEGIFEKYGLNVSHETLQAAGQLPAVLNGDFQATTSVGNAESAALQGQSFVSLMSNLTNGTAGLLVSEEIQSIEDLKGKTIVTAQAASGIYVVIRQYLEEHGLEDDVELLSQSTPDAQNTAFISGQVDGIFSTYDRVVKLSEQRDGAHILLDPDDFPAPNGAQAGISVSSDFLKDNPNTARALLAGVYDSTKFVLENPERTAEIWADTFEMTEEQATTVYDGVVDRIVLRAAPSDADYEYNAGQDSAGIQREVSVDEVKAVWDTTIAEEVFTTLDCPDVCALD